MDDHGERRDPKRSRAVVLWSLGALVAYALSCGPVLAGACWLREETGWDGFYAAFWLYFPLFWLAKLPAFAPLRAPADAYVTWWFQLFDTVGPG